MAITNNFVTFIHGHIVATELSRAQLCSIHYSVCPKRYKKNVQQIVILTLEGHKSINSFEVSIFQNMERVFIKSQQRN